MVANLRQNLPPVMFQDLSKSQNCPDSLVRLNSSGDEDMSALTVGDLKDAFRHPQISKLDKRTAWTDEKHNLYLNHLESTFTEQLHRSMGFSRWQSEFKTKGTRVSRKLSANEQHTSEELTVLQEQKLVPSGNKRLGRKRIFSNESATSSDQIPMSLRTLGASVGCLKEFSDQNFAEDVLENPNTCMSKRSKPSVADAPNEDQIVPCIIKN